MFDRLITFFARQTPQSLAVSTLAGHVSYAAFDAAIDRMAAALEDEGAGQNRLVGVSIADPYVHWVALVALARLGVASASFLRVQRSAMEALLQPNLVLTDTVEDAAAGEPRRLHLSTEWLTAAERRPAERRPRVAIDPDAVARVATSSGSTGAPKAFAVTWRMVERRLMEMGVMGGASSAAFRSLSLIGPEFTPFPAELAMWCSGATVLFGPSSVAALVQALPHLRPTSIVASPTQLQAVLDALPEGFRPLIDATLIVSGSHTSRATRQEARLRLAPQLALTYGATEMGGIAFHYDDGGEDVDAGFVSPWMELQVVGDDDVPLPFGAEGRIRVRSETVPDGYLRDQDGRSSAFRDGWFYPGDLGNVSDSGRLKVLGRLDDVMNFGGPKFMPHTLEQAALACVGARDAGAFVMKDAAGAATPWIAVVKDETLKEGDLANALRLPGLPHTHVVWIDAVPRTPTGKVDRPRLKALASALKEPQS